jgi:DNA repair exonuclease SbcCD ATPase subunit
MGIKNRFSSGSDTSRTLISFSGGEKEDAQYAITRGRLPSSLELDCDGVRVTRRTESETQALIDGALGSNRKAFTYTSHFGSHSSSILALTPKQQKEVLESILPLEKLSEWSDRANANKSILSKTKKDLELSLAELRGRIAETAAHGARAKSAYDAWESDRLSRLERAEQEVARHKVLVGNCEISQANLEAQLREIPANAEEMVYSLSDEHTKITQFAHEALSKRAEASNIHHQWSTAGANISKKVKDLERGNCYVCGQEVLGDNERLVALRNQLEIYKSNVESAEVAKNYFRERSDECRNEMNNLYKKISEYNRLRDRAGGIRIELAKLNLENLMSALEQAESVRVEVAQEKNPHSLELGQSYGDKIVLETKLSFKEATLKHINEEIQHLDFWRKAFDKDMKNFMLAKACPFLEYRTTKHLEGLGNPQLSVEFKTVKLLTSGDEREDFTINVSSATGGKTYDSLSGGEKGMVSFAVGLALADLAETQVKSIPNVMILDEPFTNMDEVNSERLFNYLTTELVNKRDTILLISNEDSLKSLVPNRIHVVKENGITSIGDPNAIQV